MGKSPELQRKRHRVDGVISQAAHTAGRHLVEGPLITDLMADVARALVPDEFDKNFVLFGFHVVAPGNFVVYVNKIVFTGYISNGDVTG
jgi:hypothetical protein